jgi:membrane-bound lytic murein transglycosylase MltF
MTKPNKQNVDSWIKNRTVHQVKALEQASKYFDNSDAFTVNTLEAIYGQESSFGNYYKTEERGDKGAVGHFQIERRTAEEYQFKITKNNDARFDIDESSEIAAQYLVKLNSLFSKNRFLTEDKNGNKISTIFVPNINERKSFAIASYNAGGSVIAKAQMAAEKDEKDPTKWEVVKEYLKEAGATDAKVKEIIEYVESVIAYEKEFAEKSKANKKLKNKNPKKVSDAAGDGHWVTLDNGNHVFIEGKKSLRK